MSKVGTYSLEELGQAQDDFWFKGGYITLESGNRVSKAELEQAQADFWDQPQTVQLIEATSSQTVREAIEAFRKAMASGEEPVSRLMRLFLTIAYDIPSSDAVIVSWPTGNSRIVLEAGNSTKLEFVAPDDGHYTQEEFDKAVADFWK